MNVDFWTFTIDNLDAAGVIGAYIAISMVAIALITFVTTDKITANQNFGPKWSQPFIGALLGVIPGCGATIVVASLFKKKRLSFGALFAAFLATLGEGSFVLLGVSSEAETGINLTTFLIVNAVGLVCGSICGCIIDFFGFKVKSNNISTKIEPQFKTFPFQINRQVYALIEGFGLYAILAVSTVLLPSSIFALWGGNIQSLAPLTDIATILLPIICFGYYCLIKLTVKGHDCSFRQSYRSTLIHTVADIAMVVTHVFIWLFIVNYCIEVVVGVDTFDKWVTTSAIVLVFIAALFGVIPGCGGMIAITVAYTTIDNFPLAALIAAALATCGDGIFPLLAKNKKDAFFIAIAGFLVAIVVGFFVLALGY